MIGFQTKRKMYCRYTHMRIARSVLFLTTVEGEGLQPCYKSYVPQVTILLTTKSPLYLKISLFCFRCPWKNLKIWSWPSAINCPRLQQLLSEWSAWKCKHSGDTNTIQVRFAWKCKSTVRIQYRSSPVFESSNHGRFVNGWIFRWRLELWIQSGPVYGSFVQFWFGIQMVGLVTWSKIIQN